MGSALNGVCSISLVMLTHFFMFMFIGVTVAMLFVTMEGLIDTGELKK